MIITCPWCAKKFELDEALIPNEGRTLKCGSCDKQWFFRDNFNESSTIKSQKISINIDNKLNQNTKIQENQFKKEYREVLPDEKLEDNKLIQKKTKESKINSFKFGKIISYFFVSIISFIAIIIILDTFKSQLSNIFPGIELMLYNLFESIKDLILFLKDLS